MNKTGIWAIIVAAAFFAGTISVNPIAEAANPVLEQIQAAVGSIQAKINNLPDDPADQSEIDAQLSSIQSDTDDIQAALDNLNTGGDNSAQSILTGVIKNPADGITERIDIIPAQEGKVFYGHITGAAAFPEGNIVFLTCVTEGNFGNNLAGTPTPSFAVINTDFACQELYFGVVDSLNGVDAGEGNIHSTTVYFETSNISVTP